MAIYCQQCGAKMPGGARFCSSCGSAITATAMPARPLMRPRVGRQIAGVCAALARRYGWDVTVVRILAVLALILSSGLIGVAYVAAWIGIPEEPLSLPGSPGAYPPGI